MFSTHFCLDTKTGGAEKNQGLPEQPVSFFLDSPRLRISLYLQQHTYRWAFHRRLPLRGRQADFVGWLKPITGRIHKYLTALIASVKLSKGKGGPGVANVP